MVTANISGVSEEIAEAVAREFKQARIEPTVDANVLDVTFTFLGSHGANRQTRRIDVPVWSEISANYPSPVRAGIDSLICLNADSALGGRLLLLHGPPGTGKTTLIRAIGSAWRSWCTTEFIADPDELFARPSYMFEVMLGEDDEPDENVANLRVGGLR